jgi:glycosyltransferase involved in cell wall biosynthesis
MDGISIIIPCLNEEHYVGKLLSSLEKQTHTTFEVIVVDGKSDDKTQEVVLSFQDKLPHLELLVSDRRQLAYQRNLGAQKAKHELLVFIDADNQFAPDFLEKSIGEIHKRKLDVASPSFEPISERIDDLFLFGIGNLYVDALQYINPVCLGWCIFSHKRVHAALDGFSEAAINAEDFDYGERATDAGYKVRFIRNAKILFSVRRLDKYGRGHYIKRAILSEVYRKFNGKIIKEAPEYEFGKFDPEMRRKYEDLKEKKWRESVLHFRKMLDEVYTKRKNEK